MRVVSVHGSNLAYKQIQISKRVLYKKIQWNANFVKTQ